MRPDHEHVQIDWPRLAALMALRGLRVGQIPLRCNPPRTTGIIGRWRSRGWIPHYALQVAAEMLALDVPTLTAAIEARHG
jgi:hypothetical protein